MLVTEFDDIYRRSLDEPEAFWAEAAGQVHWHHPYDSVFDDSLSPRYSWFPGGRLNTCYNALDIHVENGRGAQTALIYDSPVTHTVRSYSYEHLLEKTACFAGVLKAQGVRAGDRIIIYMPMIPETVIAMLACARIGAVHSVVFGGFAARELATRIDDAEPLIILTASCGIDGDKIIPYKPLLDEAISLAKHSPLRCIVFQRPEVRASLADERDLDWSECLTKAVPAGCVPVTSTDPLYILYTSGTTGIPKGVVRDNGGHLVALQWSMKNIYDLDAGDVYWAASDVGWVVGHSYIVYGPLFRGCTTILYEGKPVGTPDPGAFWRVVSEHKVNVLFTAPTAFRAIKREDPEGQLIGNYDLTSLRSLFLAGERCDTDTLGWATEKLKIPVIDHWWQTETGWPVGANCLGLGMRPIKPGSCAKAVPGYDIRVLDDEGTEVAPNAIGNVVIKLPLPPGCLPTLWQNDHGFQTTYLDTYPGYYLTADAGYKDEDDYLFIMSRTDDIINVAGHRLSTGGMEEVLSSHPDVAECAIVGIADELKGEIPCGFVVLSAGVTREIDLILAELIQLVRNEIGPVASFKLATGVQRLPKTRSGKILRGTIKKIADGETYRVPATIDDPDILNEITQSLASLGYPKNQVSPLR
ncbi:MAG: propionyl-CoA synthetase [Candidatus Latescibacteria bacterium]|nr:propionyl-CoA synthetase [Candidatus Latescibacterota bacterium]